MTPVYHAGERTHQNEAGKKKGQKDKKAATALDKGGQINTFPGKGRNREDKGKKNPKEN